MPHHRHNHSHATGVDDCEHQAGIAGKHQHRPNSTRRVHSAGETYEAQGLMYTHSLTHSYASMHVLSCQSYACVHVCVHACVRTSKDARVA